MYICKMAPSVTIRLGFRFCWLRPKDIPFGVRIDADRKSLHSNDKIMATNRSIRYFPCSFFYLCGG